MILSRVYIQENGDLVVTDLWEDLGLSGGAVTRSAPKSEVSPDSRISVYKSGIHVGEEPVVIGNHRSGMVNFSGCHLRCRFCYTPETSVLKLGERDTAVEFEERLQNLVDRGAANFNFISPTHVWHQIEASVTQFEAKLPVVMKISGYESEAIIDRMARVTAVFVPDFKVFNSSAATQVDLPSNYGSVTRKALARMLTSHGSNAMDETGHLVRGVLVRHLMMPGFIDDSVDVIRTLSEVGFRGYLNLMRHFILPDKRGLHSASLEEVERLVELASAYGMQVLVNGRSFYARHTG